jgi:hypothetical protein
MNKYYWYKHVNPCNKEIVYVGHGSGGRAWQCGSSHSPLRSKEHCKWADELLSKGITPDEWVEIGDRGLSKERAKEIELLLIHELKPRFNKSIRYPLLKFTPELFEKAVFLRNTGKSYEKIGQELALSTMTIYRGLHGKSISLETARADTKYL